MTGPAPADLLLLLSLLDLTTLEESDTPEKVRALCARAVRPLPRPDAHAAAVCVLPTLIGIAAGSLRGTPVRAASVAGGFPGGRIPTDAKLAEIRRAIADGADEIDMPINRDHLLNGREDDLAAEVRAAAQICATTHSPSLREGAGGRAASGSDGAHPTQAEPRGPYAVTPSLPHSVTALKLILETGELGGEETIRRACDLVIAAAAPAYDLNPAFTIFLKTSTGKTTPGATIPATRILFEAARAEFLRSGRVIGVKPSGGIRTTDQALEYVALAREIMGDLRTPDGACPWLTPRAFRLGASTLADDLISRTVTRSSVE